MARYFWALAIGLFTVSSAFAQAPRDNDAEEFGDEPPRRERREGRRGEDAEGGERGERGQRGSEEGPGGRYGGRGGGFRRGNAMFEAIDADSDGSISKQELRRAAAALVALDADKDGSITLAEVGGGPGGPGGAFGGGDMTQMVDQIMTQDKNGDGSLSLDEVDQRTAMMLQRADQDGNGAVSRAELTTAMEQMRQRFGGGGPGGPGGGQAFGGRGGGDMTERMMSNDANGDGKLTPDEVPERMRGMLRGADADGNGEIDAKEMAQFSRGMGERMRGAAGSGREGGRPGRGTEAGDDDDAGAERGNRRSRRGSDNEE